MVPESQHIQTTYFFDDGSFTGLTEVYIVSASAKSFHFDSQLASQVNFFGSVNSTLSVTGDVVFEQRVKSFHIDQLILKSSSGATLKTANNQFSTSISIQGSGQYSLDGYLVSQREGSTLNLAKGGLVTNGHQVFFDRILSTGNQKCGVDFGTSDVYVTKELEFSSSKAKIDASEATLYYADNMALNMLKKGKVHFKDDIAKGISVCVGGFTVDVQITSNFNGFAIQCNEPCPFSTCSMPCCRRNTKSLLKRQFLL